jgi:hypothetical protein
MPNIREYETPALDVRPTEIGIESTAAAGRRVGAFFHEAAGAISDIGQRVGGAIRAAGDTAVKYVDHQQISAGALGFAKLQDDAVTEWNGIAKTADPGDPSVGQQWREEKLEPRLQQFVSGFTTENGRRWAEAQTNQFRQHMFHQTTADMAEHAADAVHMQSVGTINTLAGTAYKDPSSVDNQISVLTSSTRAITGSSPTLTPAVASRVSREMTENGTKQIVHAAIAGAIAKGGDWQGIADRYSAYVDRAELESFVRADKTYRRMEESEARQKRADAEHDARTDFNAKVNDLELSTIPERAGDRPQLPDDYWDKMRELAKHPGAQLEPGRLRTMINNGEVITERLSKPEPLGRTSHDTTMQLLARMRATDESRLTDNGPIYDAFQQGKLNSADFNFLNREFSNLRSPEGFALEKDRAGFVKSFARLIDGSMNEAGIHSVLGTQRMYEFEMDARRQEQVLRGKGLDPHLIYDPRSEYFFGRPENVAKYRVSMQEAQSYDKTLQAMDVAAAAAAEAAAKNKPPPAAPSAAPAAPAAPQAPARPPGFPADARQAPDGNWYVERDGKFFKVQAR